MAKKEASKKEHEWSWEKIMRVLYNKKCGSEDMEA